MAARRSSLALAPFRPDAESFPRSIFAPGVTDVERRLILARPLDETDPGRVIDFFFPLVEEALPLTLPFFPLPADPPRPPPFDFPVVLFFFLEFTERMLLARLRERRLLARLVERRPLVGRLFMEAARLPPFPFAPFLPAVLVVLALPPVLRRTTEFGIGGRPDRDAFFFDRAAELPRLLRKVLPDLRDVAEESRSAADCRFLGIVPPPISRSGEL